MYDALNTKELTKRANDTSRTPELRLAAARELTRRSNLRKEGVSSWKRKLGIGVFLLAGLMLYGHADASTQRFTCGAHHVVYQFPLAAAGHEHDTLTVDGKQYVYPVEVNTDYFEGGKMIARSDIGGDAVALYIGGEKPVFAKSELDKPTRWMACKQDAE